MSRPEAPLAQQVGRARRKEWVEVDGVLTLRDVQPQPPMCRPPSWGTRGFPCVIVIDGKTYSS